MEQGQCKQSCIICKRKIRINCNFGNTLFLLISSDLSHKKVLLESMNILKVSPNTMLCLQALSTGAGGYMLKNDMLKTHLFTPFLVVQKPPISAFISSQDPFPQSLIGHFPKTQFGQKFSSQNLLRKKKMDDSDTPKFCNSMDAF